MCCKENIVCIVDVYLGFSYCFKYFVIDVGHVEFGDARTKGWPQWNGVNLYMYFVGRIIEWDFHDTGKEEFLRIFGCIAGGGIEGW